MSALPNFKSSPPSPAPRHTWPLAALAVFLGCLLVGWTGVAWRAKVRLDNRRVEAATRAMAAGIAFEGQLREAVGGADLMAVVAHHTGGNISEFQKMATSWLVGHPGVASLLLAPGGIVGAVVPRTGSDQEIGRNLLADPLLGSAARAAARRRAPAVAAPVRLAGGDPGLVVCAPVLQADRSGGELLWGYAAASVRFREVLAVARVDELVGQGCDYLLFIPAQGQQKPWSVASHGRGSFQGVPQRTIRIQDLELRLAVKPAGGMVAAKLVLETGAVVLFAGLLALLVQMNISRAGSGQLTAETEDGGARAEALLRQTQEDYRVASQRLQAAGQELGKTAEARRQAEALAGDLRGRLDEVLRRSEEVKAALEGRLKQAQTKLSDLQAAQDGSVRRAQEAARAKVAELEETRKQLAQVRKAAAEVETKMAADFCVEREAAEDLRSRLEQQQTANADLQARLEVVSRSASQSEARVEELTRLLEKVPKTAERGHNGQRAGASVASERPVEPIEAPKAEPQAKPVALAARLEPAANTLAKPELAAGVGAAAPASALEPMVATTGPADRAKTDEVPQQKRPSERGNEKPAKRKKSRRDNQMDLFAPLSPETDEQSQPATATESKSVSVQSPPVAHVLVPSTGPGGDRAQVVAGPAPKAVDQAGPPLQVAGTPEEEPASSGTVASDLPEIQGLDTDEGLATSGGDSKAYLRALGHFVEQHAGAARRIRDALVQNDITEAERQLRGLKLAAAEIGATSVQTAALAVSRALQEQADPSEAEFAWAELEKVLGGLVTELKQAATPPKERPIAARKASPAPPVDPPALRKAVNEILPLFTGQDPGAKDCLKANRNTFRSTFSADGYVDFEQLVRGGKYDEALEQLKRAIKKHGITV